MPLIIEDGSIVTGANSYQTVAQMRAYALARGVTLSAVDADVEVLSFQAMDYLEGKRAKYQGCKTSEDQALQWPREVVYIDCYEIDNNVIPSELKNAQNQLVIEIHAGLTVLPTSQQGFATKEKVGPIEVEFSEMLGTNVIPTMTAVEALLRPLYCCGQGMAVHT